MKSAGQFKSVRVPYNYVFVEVIFGQRDILACFRSQFTVLQKMLCILCHLITRTNLGVSHTESLEHMLM